MLRVPPGFRRLPRFAATPLAALLMLAGSGCRTARPVPPPPPLPPPPNPSGIPEPDLDKVETNLFLIGDAGLDTRESRRVFRILEAEIEKDPARADRARILYLGDNVYPAGVPSRAFTSAYRRAVGILRLQMEVAGATEVSGWFVPGNHDWELDAAGVRRQDEIIKTFSDRMSLVPHGACPGPEVEKVGGRLSILFIDTGWWLHAKGRGEPGCPHPNRRELVRALEEELRKAAADGRHVVLAAHHPLESFASHAGAANNEQDLDHALNCAMRDSLEKAFRRASAPPLIFAAGHDHALQVIRERRLCEVRASRAQYVGTRAAPPFQLVSGAAVKETELGRPVPDSEYVKQTFGFMQALFYTDGGVRVDVLQAGKGTRAIRLACFWLARPPGGTAPCRNLAAGS